MFENFAVMTMLGVLIGLAMAYALGHDRAWEVYTKALLELENLPTTIYRAFRAWLSK